VMPAGASVPGLQGHMASFFAETKRRKVFQVAAVYAATAWLVVQVVSIIEEPLRLPANFDTAVIVALAIGFPVALVLAWAFELTPDGIRSTAGEPEPTVGGWRSTYVAAGLFAAIPAVIGYNHFINRLRQFGAEMDDFSVELLNLIERSFG